MKPPKSSQNLSESKNQTGISSYRYSRLCRHHKINPTTDPSPPVPNINNRATGIAIQAITTNPIETIAPARVPGTDTFPNALSVAGLRLSVFGSVNNYSTFAKAPKYLPPLGHRFQSEPHLFLNLRVAKQKKTPTSLGRQQRFTLRCFEFEQEFFGQNYSPRATNCPLLRLEDLHAGKAISKLVPKSYDIPANFPNPFILLLAAIAPYCFIICRICRYCLIT
jgi:hypothetical protein